MIRRFLSITALTTCLAAPAFAAERAIIVLDASGSMWGQIDGKAKIEIARKTLGQVLGGLPGDLELGLIAYGHREKGQCRDIELMVPAGAGTAGAITDAVNSIKPKGKTPLSDSVLQAAESLKYTEDKATVILLTDGLETCDADPCALGRSLEENGIDFTAHVVGFGLSKEEGKQVSCLADETGGVYISAGNEEELVQALNETVAQPVEPPAPRASLTAPDTAPIAATIDIGWDGPGDKDDTIQFFDPNAGTDGKVLHSKRVQYGDYDGRSVDLPVAAKPGIYQLRYWDTETRTIIATRDIEVVDAEVSLTPDEPVTIGTQFNIAWVGPGDENDEIVLFDPNAGPDGKVLQSQRVIYGDYENQTATLPAPAEEGTYQLRYWNGDNKAILATRDIEVQGVPITMTPDDPISVGKSFKVVWDGPGDNYDDIQLFDPNKGPDGKVVQNKRLVHGDYDNNTVTIPGPGSAGTYELRYWSGTNRKVLAMMTVEVIDTPVTMTPDEPISVGKSFKVVWEGPGDKYDDIQLFDPNKGPDGKVVQNKRLVHGDYDNNTVTLPGPGSAGTYELRYWNGANRKILAVMNVEVVETVVSMTPDDPVSVGKAFKVVWEGPGDRYDDIQLFDPNKGPDGKVVQSTRLTHGDYDNKRITLPGPARAGTYELRYWSGANRKVLAALPIEVIETPVSLEAADNVEGATKVVVTWEGPGARNDDIQIFDPRTEKVIARKRLIHDDYDNKRISLNAPAEPGTYELRYFNNDNRIVMATRPIQVIAASVVLIAPDQIGQAATIDVIWQGPGARNDDIQVYDPATEKVVHRKRFIHGDYDNRKVGIHAPAKPGTYELRYFNNDNRAVLGTKTIEVVAVEVSLSGPDVVEPETQFAVEWVGPGARNDDIQIFNPATNKVVVRKRFIHGDWDNRKVVIKAPKRVGEYQLRYFNNDNKAVLFEMPLSVN